MELVLLLLWGIRPIDIGKYQIRSDWQTLQPRVCEQEQQRLNRLTQQLRTREVEVDEVDSDV